jgi:hypothetical protein
LSASTTISPQKSHLIPGASRRPHRDIPAWAGSLTGQSVVVIGHKGQKNRVQDALLFNAVQDGDQVEIAVKNIRGAKTIVGLRKE